MNKAKHRKPICNRKCLQDPFKFLRTVDIVNYFRKKASSQIFDWVLTKPLSKRSKQVHGYILHMSNSCHITIEALPEPQQKQEMNRFPTIFNGFQLLTIVVKLSSTSQISAGVLATPLPPSYLISKQLHLLVKSNLICYMQVIVKNIIYVKN